VSLERYTAILVYSSTYALRAEKLLLKADIPCKMIPVPRHLSSDCGVCVRILQSSRDEALAILDAAGLPYEGAHDLDC
jgi:hypothetical protein